MSPFKWQLSPSNKNTASGSSKSVPKITSLVVPFNHDLVNNSTDANMSLSPRTD